jgi:hypothetical protein
VLCWRWRLLPYAHGYICTYTVYVLAVSWESRGERIGEERRHVSDSWWFGRRHGADNATSREFVSRHASRQDTQRPSAEHTHSTAAPLSARDRDTQLARRRRPPARPGLDHLEPDCQRACAGQRPYGMSRPRGVRDHVRPGACAHSIALACCTRTGSRAPRTTTPCARPLLLSRCFVVHRGRRRRTWTTTYLP